MLDSPCGVNYNKLTNTNLPSGLPNLEDFASMVKSILAKKYNEVADEGQTFRYIQQVAGGETNHAKMA